MVTLCASFHPIASPTPGRLASTDGRVPVDLLAALRSKGMECPLRGINDPRLDYPELLIGGGWTREPLDDGYAYHRTVAEDEASGDRWSQDVEVRDNVCTLITHAGHCVHTVVDDGQGHISARISDQPSDS